MPPKLSEGNITGLFESKPSGKTTVYYYVEVNKQSIYIGTDYQIWKNLRTGDYAKVKLSPILHFLIHLEVTRNGAKIIEYSPPLHLMTIILLVFFFTDTLFIIDFLLPCGIVKGTLEEKKPKTRKDKTIYSLKVNGKTFNFDSNIEELNIGDTVKIEHTPILKIAKTLTKENL